MLRRPSLVLAVAILGCGSPSDTAVPDQITVPTEVTFRSLGEVRQLTAIVIGRDGNPMPGEPVEWTSDTPHVVAVSVDGEATSVGNGQGSVRASAGA